MPRSEEAIKIENSSEDVQILERTPRVGEDGAKIFNYQYSSRGSASDAPRTIPVVGLALHFEALALMDTDHENDHYTISPKHSIDSTSTGLGCSSNEDPRFGDPESAYSSQASQRVGTIPRPRLTGDVIAAKRTPEMASPRFFCTIENCSSTFSSQRELHSHEDEVHGGLRHGLQVGCWYSGARKAHMPHDQANNPEITSTGMLVEKFSDLKLDFSNVDAKKTDSSVSPMPSDHSAVEAGKHDATISKLNYHKSDRKEKFSLGHSSDRMMSNHGNDSKSDREENMTTAIGEHELGLHSTISVLAPNRPTAPFIGKFELKTEAAPNLDFSVRAYSILGIGAWITDDHYDLLNLVVQGLAEVYTIGEDILTLDDQLGLDWQALLTTCGANSGPGSTSQKTLAGNSSGSGSRGNHQSSPGSGNRHRKHPSDGADGADEEDDPAHSKKARTDPGTGRRFVCPFYINDPRYFRTTSQNQKFILCAAGRGFADIARLKEHLKRVHPPEIVCARCGSTFEDQDELNRHLRNEKSLECTVLNLRQPKCMTTDMMAKLSRRGKWGVNEEEKWFKIYELLFPNDARPTMGPYRQDFNQPPTPSQDTSNLIHVCENDLPRLLEQRLDIRLGEILMDPESREQTKKMVISELVLCLKELSAETLETPNSFGESQILRHKPSGQSSTDSGYVSLCGNSDCMGNCETCEQLISPMSFQSQEYFQPVSSSVFEPTDQYLVPSMFGSTEPSGQLQSTEDMDELLDRHFPFSGNPFLDSLGNG